MRVAAPTSVLGWTLSLLGWQISCLFPWENTSSQPNPSLRRHFRFHREGSVALKSSCPSGTRHLPPPQLQGHYLPYPRGAHSCGTVRSGWQLAAAGPCGVQWGAWGFSSHYTYRFHWPGGRRLSQQPCNWDGEPIPSHRCAPIPTRALGCPKPRPFSPQAPPPPCKPRRPLASQASWRAAAPGLAPSSGWRAAAGSDQVEPDPLRSRSPHFLPRDPQSLCCRLALQLGRGLVPEWEPESGLKPGWGQESELGQGLETEGDGAA